LSRLLPGGSVSLAFLSLTPDLRQISMPPSASTMFLKPLKSTSTKWLTRMPVSVSIVEIVHAMPPVL
jgi:hypothetical protein